MDRSSDAMEFTCFCRNVESHDYKQLHGVNDICPWCVGLFECALVVLVVATFAPMWGGGVRLPRCTNIKVYDHHGVRTQHSRNTSLLQFQFIFLMRDATVLCLRNCGRRVEAYSCAYSITKRHTGLHKLLYKNYSDPPSPHTGVKMTKHQHMIYQKL